jgi:hypothetical protein
MIRLRSAVAVLAVTSSVIVGLDVPAQSATVPNMYYRTCSYITGRCTPYHQTNRHDNSVGNAYYTTWCVCFI